MADDVDLGQLSDLELLERWRSKDNRAGETLTRRYFTKVRAYFITKCARDYEELVSITLWRLVEKRNTFRGDSSFRAFLFGIARIVLLEHYRQQRRDMRIDPMKSSVADFDSGRISSIAGERELHRILINALRKLKLRDQELLELRYWQGLTHGEIAMILDLKESTLRSQVQAALRRLGKMHLELTNNTDARAEADTVEGWMLELAESVEYLRVELTPSESSPPK